MKRIFASLVLTLFTLTNVSAQDYTLPDDLQPITAENAAQLTPLAQLGGAAPRGVTWSPDGQTLVAETDDGVYRYDVDVPENGAFFPGLSNVQFEASGTYAIAAGQLLYAPTFEIIDGRNLYSLKGDVIVSFERTDDGGISYLLDAATLEEFARLPTGGDVVVSADRRYAAITHSSEWIGDEYSGYEELPTIVDLWDLETETLLRAQEFPYEYFFTPQFSPSGLIVGSNGDYVGGTIELWDLETGDTIVSVFSGNIYTTPLLSPDGRWLLLEGYGVGLIRVDGTLSQTDLMVDAENVEDNVDGIFSADSSRLAVETDAGISVYDISGTAPHLIGKLSDSSLVKFGNQTPLLLTLDNNGVLSLWDVGDNDVELRMSISLNAGRILLSPDEQQLFISNTSLYDTTSGEIRYTFPTTGVPQFNADWSYVAYWDVSSLVVVDLNTSSERVLITLENNLGTLLEINPISEMALFRGDDALLRIYDLRTGEVRFEYADVTSAYFSANGTHLVTRTETNTTVWDITGTTPNAILSLDTLMRGSVINADGTRLAFISSPQPESEYDVVPHTVEVWDVTSGTQIGMQVIEGRGMLHLDMSANVLAISLWERVLFCPITLNDEPCGIVEFPFDTFLIPNRVVFSADGVNAAIQLRLSGPDGANGSHLYLVALDTLDELEANGYSDTLRNSLSPLYSPDGTLLLTGDAFPSQINPPRHLRLRNIAGEELFVFDGLLAGTFSPDSQLIATGSAGVQLWDVDALRTGEATPMATLESNNVRGLIFNADGTLLFVYEPHRVTVWGVAP